MNTEESIWTYDRGGCRLHNEELHNSYFLSNIVIKSRKMSRTGHVARMGEMRNAYEIVVGRLEQKIHLGRPRRRWKDCMKMDLKIQGITFKTQP
jgi:hypothetical protein